MSSINTPSLAEHGILSVVPHRRHDLARLRILNTGDDTPVITVIGKYNHGKSRLLNELIGRDVFSVADKRETVRLAEHEHDGVRWLDAPGLDADVGNADDRLAVQAIWLWSDVRLMVHSAKEGELDADERALLHELYADSTQTQRQTLLVLTQVDQLADDTELHNVSTAILAQVPTLDLHSVSSTRHRKGTQESKALLISKSGIPSLKAAIGEAIKQVPDARSHEKSVILTSIQSELQQRADELANTLAALQHKQVQGRQTFNNDLDDALVKVAGDIKDLLDVPGPDHSLTPDSAEDRYTVTAGKLERARLQIAYSKACIFLNGILIRHGVFELPTEQQTAAASLNSVMVAVMGVSVKYRKDLHRIFLTTAGQGNLQRQFTHYFELSSDRQALLAQIADTESCITAADRALAALSELESVALP